MPNDMDNFIYEDDLGKEKRFSELRTLWNWLNTMLNVSFDGIQSIFILLTCIYEN